MTVNLTAQQRAIADSIREKWLQALSGFHSTGSSANVRALIDSAADDAHTLHLRLEAAGQSITHKKQLIVNRGVAPDNPEFYRNLHAIEDFLEIIGCSVDRGVLREVRRQNS